MNKKNRYQDMIKNKTLEEFIKGKKEDEEEE